MKKKNNRPKDENSPNLVTLTISPVHDFPKLWSAFNLGNQGEGYNIKGRMPIFPIVA
jgi:hypothetical protein